MSVNAPNDAIRNEIMPLNRAMNMAKLRLALDAWTGRHRLPVLIEYVLIPGVNDAPALALELAEWLAGLSCRVKPDPIQPASKLALACALGGPG